MVSESRETCRATSVPILVFLDLSVLDLGEGPMYARDRRRQTSDAHHRLMSPPYWGGGIKAGASEMACGVSIQYED